jgi:hypothetical protein
MTVIDATVGNGHDTFFLASLLKGKGRLIGYDIQPKALEQTQKRLAKLPDNWREIVNLRLESHALFSESNVKLIVYNLGYLPGGDKTITTQTESTLLSIRSALHCLDSHGAISIMCYPGHTEGQKELIFIKDFLKSLPSNRWHICQHEWINRPLAPTWIWLQGAHDA